MSVTNRVFTWKPPASSTSPETGWALTLLTHYFCIFGHQFNPIGIDSRPRELNREEFLEPFGWALQAPATGAVRLWRGDGESRARRSTGIIWRFMALFSLGLRLSR